MVTLSNLPIFRNFFNKTVSPKEMHTEKNGKHIFHLKGNKKFNFQAGIDDLDMGVAQAKNIENPSRVLLYNVYESHNDLHVKSQIRTANFKVISSPAQIIDKNRKKQKNLTELFEKKWFDDLNQHILSTEYWGHSLIYFFLNDSGEFSHTKLFPRMHVNPESGCIIPDLSNYDRSISFRENELFKKIFIEVGESGNLGLLQDICRHSIYKRYSFQDWARSSEKFGDPHLILKSESDSEEENDAKEEHMKNFGNNGYMMTGKDDEIELLERKSSGNAHNIYKDFIKINNDENSKGINGQVATSDEKSFVGSAEVQERILNDYTLSRLRSLMHFHNEITIPFLVQYNDGNTAYKALEGMRWVPLELMHEEKKEENPKPPKPVDPKNRAVNPFT